MSRFTKIGVDLKLVENNFTCLYVDPNLHVCGVNLVKMGSVNKTSELPSDIKTDTVLSKIHILDSGDPTKFNFNKT